MEEIYNYTDYIYNGSIHLESTTDRPLHIPSLVSLIVFYFVILVLGIFASWKKKTLSEKSSVNVMLAGRDIGVVIGIFTLTATWVGGGYINGTSQAVFESGLVWCQAPVAYTIGLVLSGLFFAKPMRRAGYVTMLDVFQIKYGGVMTAFIYIPALFGDVFWSASILSALGSSLYVITGLSHTWSVVISAAVAILYTFLGGLYSVAFTDVIQLLFIFVGLWLAVPFALTHDAVTSIAVTAHSNSSWLGGLPPTPEIGTWIDFGLLLIMGGIPWQVYYQRVLSQRTAERAQVLSYFAAAGCFLLSIPAAILGAVCKSTAWNETEFGREPEAAMALPMVMQYLTPKPVAVIGLGAVSAAVMSSADSAILSSSTMFAHNVYTPIRNAITSFCSLKPASDTEVLVVMRGSIFFIGAAGTVLAIVIKSVYDLFVLCGDLLYVILFPQLLCAVHIPFSNTYGALAGYMGGMFFRLSGGEHMLNFHPLIYYPYYDADVGQQFPFRTMSMLICLLLIISVSWLTKLAFRSLLPPRADIFKCMANLKSEISINNVRGEDEFMISKQSNTSETALTTHL